jgi:hypothetical protein
VQAAHEKHGPTRLICASDVEPIRLTEMGRIETRLDELGLELASPAIAVVA